MLEVNAYAKINWSLAVLDTRPDGYHALDMLMQRISLHDVLTFESANRLTLTVDNKVIDNADDNLVMRAAYALNRYAGTNKGASISLHKHIPARAGLGGGSADCAVTLLTLNRMWGLNISRSELEAIGLSLGADVPFCVREQFCRAEGIGEILTPIANAPRVPIALVTPGGGLSTPEVFRKWNAIGCPHAQLDNIALAKALSVADWDLVRRISRNDLEAPAFDLMPEISELIDRFYALGARFARMTGSGSTVFAVFDDLTSASAAANAIPGAIACETMGDLS